MKRVHEKNQLSRLVLNGYKSIAGCDIDLCRLNVLIGANGAGKSNFIGFFRLISRILDEQLQNTVGAAGGPDALLHFGRKTTEEMRAELYFGSHHGYKFNLRPTQDNRMMFAREVLWWNFRGEQQPHTGHFETRFAEPAEHDSIQDAVVSAMRSWRVHHFHDTGATALVKQIHAINDNEYLREDGRNLAAFLYRLQQHHAAHYKRIVKSIQLVAPSFGDFHLRPTVGNAEKIQLEWTEAGQDAPFNASALSDGTLRFICLATVLQQPEAFMPSSILIDEPELGLHPYAIAVLGAMMKSVTQQYQLIISTQSVDLVNEFDAEDLVVVDKSGGASTFKRLDSNELSDWLADYSLGELWKKNLLGGRPTR
ncbi:chromosome segregation protein SMC [Rhizobacter sp. Root16D2]|nr:chromosome segregation protein SMC [Rhizobacter sp. Root29]KQW09766.1 chromosome segregation protein SMC [Rhizobacter sp. Root1238]KRB14824.1 chromosome segregation protein SMC [Rhizobacter sp. Root16D2]